MGALGAAFEGAAVAVRSALGSIENDLSNTSRVNRLASNYGHQAALGITMGFNAYKDSHPLQINAVAGVEGGFDMDEFARRVAQIVADQLW